VSGRTSDAVSAVRLYARRVRTLVLVTLIASCSQDTRCYDQSDCALGTECTHYQCVATTCNVPECGMQCGDAVDDGCGGTMSCGVCQSLDTCLSTCAPDGHRLVFVTSDIYVGGMIGGLAGGDAICQMHAARAHFNGTFRAWLSDSTGTPAERMVHGIGKYSTTDGVPIAKGWEDMILGQLIHSIHLDEFGQFHGGGTGCHMEPTAWTGTNTDGTLYTGGAVDNTCGNWDDVTSEGMVGNTNGSGLAWSLDCNVPCNYATALYCFEQ
jgi:hypothetical protein